MTLTELRYIVTLAQEQHFGHAAERCHVSQPTLSVGVKKLEDELGVLIFERSKSAVRLTPVGEGIVAQAQKVLEQAQGIRELAQAGKNQLTAPLKVGAIYTVGPYLFPHLIPQLHRVAPQMPLYIEENFTHVLRDKLRNGELDAIIIALPFSEADVHDNRVALFARFVQRGVYEYTYFARATTAGSFHLPPATAYEQYFPEVFGRSDGGSFTVTEAAP